MKRPCQAVVVRVSPDAASGEMLNVGVVLRSPEHRFFGCRFTKAWRRVSSAFPGADVQHLRRIHAIFERGCAREYALPLDSEAHPQGIVEAVRRFLPDEDASIVLSSAISGLTADPSRSLDELFERFVSREAAPAEARRTRRDDDVWRGVSKVLKARGLLDKLTPKEIRGKHHAEKFEASWMNGHLHVARPVSLDLVDAQAITEKAASWTGRVRAIEPAATDVSVLLVVGMPDEHAAPDLVEASGHGLAMLREQLQSVAEVLTDADANQLADRIEADLAHHAAGGH